MKRRDDDSLLMALRQSMRKADDNMPEALRARLVEVRARAIRQALVAAHDSRRCRTWLLGWGGAALGAAAVVLILLWSPVLPPPEYEPFAIALTSEQLADDIPLLLDSDFELLAETDPELDPDDDLAFYAWVAQNVDAESEPAAAAADATEIGG